MPEHENSLFDVVKSVEEVVNRQAESMDVGARIRPEIAALWDIIDRDVVHYVAAGLADR